MAGPYERFSIHYPRNWDSIVGEGGDPIHLTPLDHEVSVTVSGNAEPILGPQGIINLIEGMATARGVKFARRTVAVDRWGEDGWAGSWAWREKHPDGTSRTWRTLVLGHDQGSLIAMVNGEDSALAQHAAQCEKVLATTDGAAMTLPGISTKKGTCTATTSWSVWPTSIAPTWSARTWMK